jgi:hypothetical protein
MHIDRLLNTELGHVFISILLGLGLATLFRKVCKDKNCIVFNGPVISEVDNKTFKHGDECYKYTISPTKCDATKQIIDIGAPEKNADGTFKIMPTAQPSTTKDTSTTTPLNPFSQWFK